MRHRNLHERLRSLERNLGSSTLSLRLGRRTIELVGLDASLAADLERRWGGFVVAQSGAPADCVVRFHRGGAGTWLDHWQPAESYRLETVGEGEQRLVASYHFGIAREEEPATWRVGLSDDPAEPVDRVAENVVRFLAAHLALDDGGFALHSAGVLRDGRAYHLAGPSRAGKTTASKLIDGAESLGDDFGMIVREGSRWWTPALPFDNAEQVGERPSSGLYPLVGVWRVHQAEQTYTKAAGKLEASAALMSCAAFAWAMPERADELLDHVRSFAAQGLFGQLHFALGADLWPLLEAGPGVDTGPLEAGSD
jgi:hypothetical protein